MGYNFLLVFLHFTNKNLFKKYVFLTIYIDSLTINWIKSVVIKCLHLNCKMRYFTLKELTINKKILWYTFLVFQHVVIMFVADVQHLCKNILPRLGVTLAYSLSLEVQNEFTINDKNILTEIQRKITMHFFLILSGTLIHW